MLCQNDRLHGLFDRLDLAIERPDVGLEAEAGLHLDLVLVVQQHHALADLTARVPQPLLRELGQVDQN